MQLLCRCLRGIDLKANTDGLKTNGHLFRYAQGTPKIQISFYLYLNPVRCYAHSCSDLLAGDLRTGDKGSQKQISLTSGSACSSHPPMLFGLIQCTCDRD